MISQHPECLVGRLLASVAATGELFAERDQRRELVSLEHARLVLEDASEAVEAEPGVDVLGRQRCQDPLGVLVELHEHQVPVLEEALVVATGQIVGLAELQAAVQIQLRARAARPGRSHLPEVLVAVALHDPLARDADLHPGVDRLLVRAEA